jgi:murein DD-endopeptidase MepM/ murein hydrolase activator NlpD
MPPAFIWPLGNSTTPDEMNTSFGPRIDENRWDFHDGVDLPAPMGTPIHAVSAGKVHHAGEGGTGGYSSRHVVIETEDVDGDKLYTFYFHLSKTRQVSVSP